MEKNSVLLELTPDQIKRLKFELDEAPALLDPETVIVSFDVDDADIYLGVIGRAVEDLHDSHVEIDSETLLYLQKVQKLFTIHPKAVLAFIQGKQDRNTVVRY